MKILIAVPTFENIYPDTFKSIYDLDVSGHEVFFEFVRGYDCATARNKIAKLSLERGADYVLSVDNDTVVPKQTLIWMLEDAKDVCLGYYAHRGADNLYHGNTNICRLFDQKGEKYFNYPLESEYLGSELNAMAEEKKYKVKVHGGGMGCSLINTAVFKKIKYPWYDWVHYRSGKMLGEDLYFCEQCRKNSISIYVDTRVNCGHMLRHVQFAD